MPRPRRRLLNPLPCAETEDSPAANGTLKGELLRIVEEQRGSDVTQAFVIKQIKVDPGALSSEVKGTLKTFVGATVIGSDERRFRFSWTYQGLRLGLAGFVQLLPEDTTKESK